MPPDAQYALGLLITQSISSLSLNHLCRQVNFRIFTFYTQILPHHHRHFNALPARTNSRRHRETSQQATPSLQTRTTRALLSIGYVWRLVKTKARAAAAAAAAAAVMLVNEEGRRSYESWITESFHSEVSRRSSI